MRFKRLALVPAVVFATCLPVLASTGTDAGGGDMTHKMTVLAIQVGVILFAARLGGMIAERLRMPGVLGELLVGVVAIVPAGIQDYTTIDGSPVKMLVLTISPIDLQTPHLRLIAHIAQVLDETGRMRMLAARTEAAMREVFLGAHLS